MSLPVTVLKLMNYVRFVCLLVTLYLWEEFNTDTADQAGISSSTALADKVIGQVSAKRAPTGFDSCPCSFPLSDKNVRN